MTSLKDFPSKQGVTPVEWCILAEEWKEAFEKELQALINGFPRLVTSEKKRVVAFSLDYEKWLKKLRVLGDADK